MIEYFSYIIFCSPDKDDAIAEDFIGKNEFFLTNYIDTKESMEVSFQSMLMKIPWRSVAQVSGLALVMSGSE